LITVNYPQQPHRIGVPGGAMNVAVGVDNEFIEDDLGLFEAGLTKDDEIISERLNVLMGLLKDL